MFNLNFRILKWRCSTIQGHMFGGYTLTYALYRPLMCSPWFSQSGCQCKRATPLGYRSPFPGTTSGLHRRASTGAWWPDRPGEVSCIPSRGWSPPQGSNDLNTSNVGITIINHPWPGMVDIPSIYGDDWGMVYYYYILYPHLKTLFHIRSRLLISGFGSLKSIQMSSQATPTPFY